jgi:hypothetical protein
MNCRSRMTQQREDGHISNCHTGFFFLFGENVFGESSASRSASQELLTPPNVLAGSSHFSAPKLARCESEQQPHSAVSCARKAERQTRRAVIYLSRNRTRKRRRRRVWSSSNESKESKAKQKESKAKQKQKQSRAKQSKANHSRAKKRKEKKSTAKHSTAKQSKANHSKAE